VNPKLSKFCTDLTAITQDMVDSGVPIGEAIKRHAEWLRGHGLVGDGEEEGLPRFVNQTLKIQSLEHPSTRAFSRHFRAPDRVLEGYLE
jgi:inhibitor of KinA sporulation pathway (predicted exonuclease)